MRRTKTEVKEYIDNFICGSGGSWDWDDFISIPIENPDLEQIRLRCLAVATSYPSMNKNEYCSADGITELRKLADLLYDDK